MKNNSEKKFYLTPSAEIMFSSAEQIICESPLEKIVEEDTPDWGWNEN